jgi:hypothetical protein
VPIFIDRGAPLYVRALHRAGQAPFLRHRSAKPSSRGRGINRAAYHLLHLRIRQETIAKCDRILVMDKGEIIEQGSHNELMVAKGAYHRFFQLQSRL